MLPRLSVKKPYTVLVAIVLVIILGAVSFSKMDTDLLPSMSLPYAIVMTTYVGASPETVETVVTRPVEQSMATVSNIKNISSQSMGNMSMVILEFEQSTNMDSVTIEIREKLDQISGYWDEMVGKPMIMKINPDMLPIMIAAVEIEGLSATEVTDYVKNHLEAELESVSGVASVSTTGNITESVQVILREEKLSDANRKVMRAVNQSFKESEEELADAEKQLKEGKEALEKGKEQLESGKEQLETGKTQMASGLQEGVAQMTSAEARLAAGEAELEKNEKLLDEKQAELNSGLEKIASGRQQAQTMLTLLQELQGGLKNLWQTLEALNIEAEELVTGLRAVEDGISEISSSQTQMLDAVSQLERSIAALDEQIRALGGDPGETTAGQENTGTPSVAKEDAGTASEEHTSQESEDSAPEADTQEKESVQETTGPQEKESVQETTEPQEKEPSPETGVQKKEPVQGQPSQEEPARETVSMDGVPVPEPTIPDSGELSDFAGTDAGDVIVDLSSILQGMAYLDETPLTEQSAINQITALKDQKAKLEAQKLELQNQIARLQEQKNTLNAQKETIQQGIDALEEQRKLLADQIAEQLEGLGMPSEEEAFAYLEEQTSTLTQTISELDAAEAQIKEAQPQLDKGREALEEAKKQLLTGKLQLSAGKTQLDVQSILGAVQMSSAEIQMTAGSSELKANEEQIDAAQAQLDAGKDQLKDAKKQVKEQVDLNNLVSKELVKGILAGENFSMPAGYIHEEKDEYLVRVGDKFETMGSIGDLVLLDLGMEGLDPIRLGDVADVILVDDSDSAYARLNGQPGVMLTMEKQTGYSTGDVTDRLLKRIEEIEEEKSNVHFSVLMDQGVYIDLVVDSVIGNMISGAALAILILLLFLKDIRPTVVIGFSIPISVVTAFVLMYFSNITLNVISLSGLALGIGMLVDNSIVVIENIDRLRQNGVPARKAAVAGANEVAGAIAASTLTTVCVFAPIVFAEGITRQLFVDMGLTIAYSLLASLVVALSLVPAMSAGLLRRTKPKKFRILDAIRNVYGKLLSGALHVKLLVILLALGLLLWSGYAAIQKGTAFMPEMESTQATMTVSVENGTPFSELVECSDQVLEKIQDIEDIESIGAMSGGGGMMGLMGGGGASGNSVDMYLLLKEERTLNNTELEQELLERTKDLPCQISVSTQTMDMSALGGSGIQVRIKGRDLDRLSELCVQVAKLVEETEGTKNVSDGQEESDQEFRIVVDKAKAMKYQLTVAQVFQEISGRLAEASAATILATEDKDYSVYVNAEKDTSLKRSDLENYSFEITKQDGTKVTVKLSEIAEFQAAFGPQTISRDAQTRYMTVSAEIDAEHNIGLVSSALENKLAAFEFPNGYSYEMAGEDETINEAMEQLLLMLVLAVAFMYLIMVAQFQSLLSPFIVMFTIPLAFTGGFMGLLIADMELSVIAMIGFIMLSGIIVNNGIVLVDYTNQLRAEGMEKHEALVQAGKDRLRPIVMTALTTILGLSTMAAGNGMGAGLVQPMAVVTIGGLIYGTLLTLFVVPCIYDLLNRKKYRRFDEDSDEEI